jgi:hypothetical protein
MLVKKLINRIRKGEELKASRHASAAATRDSNLLSRDGSLPYVTATCLIPDTGNSSFIVAIYI